MGTACAKLGTWITAQEDGAPRSRSRALGYPTLVEMAS